MVGGAGSLSARLDDGSFWITDTGKPRGELTKEDFLRITGRGENDAAVNEAVMHRALYETFPNTRAVYHIHSIEANLVTEWRDSGGAPLPALEMLKGFGLDEQEPQVTVPIFENHLRVAYIAKEIRERFKATSPEVPGFLIRHHGLTVWAESTERARTYIELFDYVFKYMIARGR